MAVDILTKATCGYTIFIRMRDYLLNLPTSTGTTVSDERGRRVTLRGKAARLWSKLVSSNLEEQ